MSTETIDYRAVLKDLEQRRAKLQRQQAEIDAAIKGIKAILGDGSTDAHAANNGNPPLSQPEILPNLFAGMTTVEAAKTFLKMSHSKKTTSEIFDAFRRGGLKPASTNSIYVILYKAMKKKGVFVRDGQRWALADAWEREMGNPI